MASNSSRLKVEMPWRSWQSQVVQRLVKLLVQPAQRRGELLRVRGRRAGRKGSGDGADGRATRGWASFPSFPRRAACRRPAGGVGDGDAPPSSAARASGRAHPRRWCGAPARACPRKTPSRTTRAPGRVTRAVSAASLLRRLVERSSFERIESESHGVPVLKNCRTIFLCGPLGRDESRTLSRVSPHRPRRTVPHSARRRGG